MNFQGVRVFVETNGDSMILIWGPVIGVIVSFIYWIIFLIQLDKARDIDVSSLVVGKNEEYNQFFISYKESLESSDSCYIF